GESTATLKCPSAILSSSFFLACGMLGSSRSQSSFIKTPRVVLRRPSRLHARERLPRGLYSLLVVYHVGRRFCQTRARPRRPSSSSHPVLEHPGQSSFLARQLRQRGRDNSAPPVESCWCPLCKRF